MLSGVRSVSALSVCLPQLCCTHIPSCADETVFLQINDSVIGSPYPPQYTPAVVRARNSFKPITSTGQRHSQYVRHLYILVIFLHPFQLLITHGTADRVRIRLLSSFCFPRFMRRSWLCPSYVYNATLRWLHPVSCGSWVYSFTGSCNACNMTCTTRPSRCSVHSYNRNRNPSALSSLYCSG